MGIGNGKRRRLPDNLLELLTDLTVRQHQIEDSARRAYKRLDSDSAMALRPYFEIIIENANATRDILADETDHLRDLMMELRDLRDEVKGNNGNGH